MWQIKFTLRHSNCIYAPKLKKLKLNTSFYPLGNYSKNTKTFTSSMQIVHGSKEQIKKYYSLLQKEKQIKKIEINKNIIYILEEHKKNTLLEILYNPKLLYPHPGELDKKENEVWEIACWERKPLEKIIKALKKEETTEFFELKHFIQKEINEVYIGRVQASLSPKQKETIQLAYKEGYYTYPKSIDLNRLSKMAKIGKSTFQEHLRKAEQKIISFFMK